ncbi:hypothetical protein L2E82_11310 [Cichorium intybus]|uniref:Uncharacterized protein n=1 Tax=Cichorium intybus TaxID=13427 RepID=A0ACB9GE71_CICIN|nr:hypothetical protein L2E82_11310 [Cichorium intybus]
MSPWAAPSYGITEGEGYKNEAQNNHHIHDLTEAERETKTEAEGSNHMEFTIHIDFGFFPCMCGNRRLMGHSQFVKIHTVSHLVMELKKD